MSFENILNHLMGSHYLGAIDLSVLRASSKQVNQQITEIASLQGYKKEARRIDDAHEERQTSQTKRCREGCPGAPKKKPTVRVKPSKNKIRRTLFPEQDRLSIGR